MNSMDLLPSELPKFVSLNFVYSSVNSSTTILSISRLNYIDMRSNLALSRRVGRERVGNTRVIKTGERRNDLSH